MVFGTSLFSLTCLWPLILSRWHLSGWNIYITFWLLREKFSFIHNDLSSVLISVVRFFLLFVLVFMKETLVSSTLLEFYPGTNHSCLQLWLVMFGFKVPYQDGYFFAHLACFCWSFSQLYNCVPSRMITEISGPQLALQRAQEAESPVADSPSISMPCYLAGCGTELELDFF